MLGFKKRKLDYSKIAAIDIGSSKIACVIANKLSKTDEFNIIGIGQHISNGMNSGTVTNAESLALSIGEAVSSAEKMAGSSVKDTIIILSGGEQSSKTVSSCIEIGGREVEERDVKKVINQCISSSILNGRYILHAIPNKFKIDNSSSIKNPLGMIANKLTVSVNICSIRDTALSNIAKVIERNHLNVIRFVSSALAIGSGVLMQEERDLGSIIIDLGSSNTTVGIFSDNSMVYSFDIPLGGKHISRDIANGLATTLIDAERIKALHGNLINSEYDYTETISIPLVGGNSSTSFQNIPLGLLNDIIKARFCEIFELIQNHLSNTPFYHIAMSKTVLTGGGSNITGLTELASDYLSKHIRVGGPNRINGLPDAAFNAYFSSVVGLFFIETNEKDSLLKVSSDNHSVQNLSSINRFYQWLTANL